MDIKKYTEQTGIIPKTCKDKVTLLKEILDDGSSEMLHAVALMEAIATQIWVGDRPLEFTLLEY